MIKELNNYKLIEQFMSKEEYYKALKEYLVKDNEKFEGEYDELDFFLDNHIDSIYLDMASRGNLFTLYTHKQIYLLQEEEKLPKDYSDYFKKRMDICLNEIDKHLDNIIDDFNIDRFFDDNPELISFYSDPNYKENNNFICTTNSFDEKVNHYLTYPKQPSLALILEEFEVLKDTIPNTNIYSTNTNPTAEVQQLIIDFEIKEKTKKWNFDFPIYQEALMSDHTDNTPSPLEEADQAILKQNFAPDKLDDNYSEDFDNLVEWLNTNTKKKNTNLTIFSAWNSIINGIAIGIPSNITPNKTLEEYPWWITTIMHHKFNINNSKKNLLKAFNSQMPFLDSALLDSSKIVQEELSKKKLWKNKTININYE